MRSLGSYGVSGWSWLNALGRHVSLLGDPCPSNALAEAVLRPHSPDLGLPGRWGNVELELPELPAPLRLHQSRAAELLLATAEPLRALIEDARARYGKARVGIVLGSSTGGIDATERAFAEERRTGRRPEDYSFDAAHGYHALIDILRDGFELEGFGYVISTACSSSGKALGAAQRALETGALDAVLTGGVDALCGMTLRGFAGLGILSPTGCRPFDASRDGISIGEGAALLLLERETKSPYRLLGVGESNDAHHTTAPHPEGLGASMAMERALEIAGLHPSRIEYINAHGTGTLQNDSVEALAIARVFGTQVAFSSTKDRTGHQLGAAGATEALFCLHALQTRTLPANRRPGRVDATLTHQPLTESRSSSVSAIALSNSFAFGGSNVSVILGVNAPVEPARPPSAGRLFVLGASLWSPGLPHAEAWLHARSEASCLVPQAELLPVRTRGRASQITRIFAELYGQLASIAAPVPEGEPALIFGSAYGELTTTIELLDQMSEDLTLSPARFQSSVHNTAAGLLTITTHNRGFATAIAAGASTFAMSLIETVNWLRTQGGEAWLLVADELSPQRLLPPPQDFPALGVGLRLLWSESGGVPPGALVELGVPSRATPTTELPARGALSNAPAAWGLDLLESVLTKQLGLVRIGPETELEVREL